MGLKVNSKDMRQNQPVHEATMSRDTDALEMLVNDYKADKDCINDKGTYTYTYNDRHNFYILRVCRLDPVSRCRIFR